MHAHDERSGPAGNGTAPVDPQVQDQGTTRNPKLDSALEWVAVGVAVFPCKPGTKEPATAHGFKDATTDQAQIRAWWERNPHANPAAATGAVSQLVVLDPDDGETGAATLARLEKELGQLPPTYTVRTPGDPAKGKAPGRHIYLDHPGERVKNRAGESWRPWGKDREPATGLDVRGDGGYVMLPGSVLPSGNYTAENLELAAKAPPAWATLLTTGKVPTGTAPAPAPEPAKVDGAGLFELAAKPGQEPDSDPRPAPEPGQPFTLASSRTFTREQAVTYMREQADARVLAAKPGNRNHTLNAAAMVYGHFTDRSPDDDQLMSEDVAIGRLQRMAEHMGLDEDEALPTIRSGLRAGMAEPYTVTPDPAPAKQEESKRTQAILDAALDATDLDNLPEPDQLLPGYLNRAEYVLLSGKFGTYKSFVALGWAYALATGQAWGDQDPADPAPVVYVAAEGITGLRGRLRALERRHGIKVPAGMLTVIRRPVHLTNPDEMLGLAMIVQERAAQLVILDTWHRMTPGIEENSATETGGPLDRLLALRDDYGATVLLVHHTGHAQRHARGSSALEDDADSSWMIRLGDGTEDDESRSAATPRTLIHRKSKDGELAEGRQLRLQVDEAGAATVDLDPFVLAPPTREPGKRGRAPRVDHHAAVLELVQALDAAGKPDDLSQRLAEEWDAQRRPGQAAPRAVVREAVNVRRGRARETAQALAE